MIISWIIIISFPINRYGFWIDLCPMLSDLSFFICKISIYKWINFDFFNWFLGTGNILLCSRFAISSPLIFIKVVIAALLFPSCYSLFCRLWCQWYNINSPINSNSQSYKFSFVFYTYPPICLMHVLHIISLYFAQNRFGTFQIFFQ